jgi:selenocysteine lyase/cysteine desulfurase
VLTHASNVTGALQPVGEIGRALRSDRPLLLVDAAQSLGHVPLDADEMGADLIAAPGHKGLLGPLGTGILYVGDKVQSQLASLRQGGTGTDSDRPVQPALLPEKFEAGNLNVPGIVGLSAGVAYLLERGIESIRREEMRQTSRLIEGLRSIRGVCLYGPADICERVGVVSFQVDDCPPQQAAAMLDSAHRVQARAGIHCAPWMHRHLGTLAIGGTVRFSPGPMTTDEELDKAVRAVESLAATVAAL